MQAGSVSGRLLIVGVAAAWVCGCSSSWARQDFPSPDGAYRVAVTHNNPGSCCSTSFNVNLEQRRDSLYIEVSGIMSGSGNNIPRAIWISPRRLLIVACGAGSYELKSRIFPERGSSDYISVSVVSETGIFVDGTQYCTP